MALPSSLLPTRPPRWPGVPPAPARRLRRGSGQSPHHGGTPKGCAAASSSVAGSGCAGRAPPQRGYEAGWLPPRQRPPGSMHPRRAAEPAPQAARTPLGSAESRNAVLRAGGRLCLLCNLGQEIATEDFVFSFSLSCSLIHQQPPQGQQKIPAEGLSARAPVSPAAALVPSWREPLTHSLQRSSRRRLTAPRLSPA